MKKHRASLMVSVEYISALIYYATVLLKVALDQGT